MKKGLKWKLLMILATMVVCLAGCGTQKLSLKEYVSVSYEGYSGSATATLDVDKEGLNALVDSKKVNDYVTGLVKGTMFEGYEGNSNFSDMVQFVIANEKATFANGDVITVEIRVSPGLEMFGGTLESMQEALGISLESTKFEITVEGLENAKVLDVLGFVDKYIVYKGASGGADAEVVIPKEFVYEKDGFSVKRGSYTNSVEIVYNHQSIAQIAYDCKYDGKLSEGQSYKIIARNIHDSKKVELGETGYVINTEKEVKATKLGKYITSKNELTSELKEELDAQLVEQMRLKDVTGIKYYWGTIKESTTTNNIEQDRYRIFAIVTTDSWIMGEQQNLYYTSQMIQLSDGTYDLKFLSTYAVLNLEENMKADYDIEKITW